MWITINKFLITILLCLKYLFQQLKNFIEKKSFNPSIDENYFARSNIDTKDFIQQDTAIYILVFYITSFITVIVITLALLWITYISHRWDRKLILASPRKDTNKYTQSKVLILVQQEPAAS